MDFDYPDFDEDFSLTPKPKPKPEVEASSDPLGLLNNVPDTAKPPIPTSGGQARPSVDRSTKPKPSPSNNSLNSIHNVFPTSQTDSKTISVPKNNLMAEAQRKEKRAAEEVVRSKEEEMRIQTEKDKEAEEQEAKRQKLQREIQVM